MNSPQQLAGAAVPDLQDVSVEQIAKLGDSVLAHSLALYRDRRAESGTLRCAFSSSI